MYPEVAGTVKEIFVSEGQTVRKGTPLLLIDDSIQRATVEQQLSQAQAAHATLEELKAQPHKETLDVAAAQMQAAQASLQTAADQLDKQRTANTIDPGSISKDSLDGASNAKAVAETNLEVTKRQYTLTKAGAWVYDINNQERQFTALEKAYAASTSLLGKYTLRAPQDSIVLSINTMVGAYVSAQGAYDSYTQGTDPVLIVGNSDLHLNVRCYVDEILVSRLRITLRPCESWPRTCNSRTQPCNRPRGT
jgi:HlyD family secretion protein